MCKHSPQQRGGKVAEHIIILINVQSCPLCQTEIKVEAVVLVPTGIKVEAVVLVPTEIKVAAVVLAQHK